MKTPQIPVAKEGYPFILFSAFASLLFGVTGLCWLAYFGLVVTAFVLYFFRDPERFIPNIPHAVIAPADGKVIAVSKEENNEFLEADAYKISIFMNVFNVHVNRSPFSGTVRKVLFTPGKFYAADSEKSMLLNENCATVIETDNHKTIAFVQVAGLIARRIVNWLEVGDEIKKGDRFGLIRFGSRVDMYFPADSVIGVEEGQKVRAGETVICYLNT